MMKKNLFPVLILSLSVAFAGCKKDEDETPIPPDPTPVEENDAPAQTTPTIAGADAALWSINSHSSINGIAVSIGTAVGYFSEDANFETFVDAGNVSVDGQTMDQYDNNSYGLYPSPTNPMGIDFDDSVIWEVSGGNGVEGFTQTSDFTWPNVPDINSAGTVSKSSGYTASVPYIENADSVYFLIGEVIKSLPGNAVSCTFTAEELSGLENGTNIVSINATRTEYEVIGGKTVYFGKMASRSKTVTIED